MKPQQYAAARKVLGWSHAQVARLWARDERTVYRYSSGDNPIPPELGRLLRVLVILRLTLSKPKFEAVMREIEKEG